MFSRVHLKNCGVFADFAWSELGRVNVVVGENDTGKTHLLKALYVIAKSLEVEQLPGREATSWRSLVASKMRWTFQPRGGLGTLIRHGARRARIKTTFSGTGHSFSWGRVPNRKAIVLRGAHDSLPSRDISAIFIPPKEILTTFSAIAVTRERLEIFGFDDTYYDLIKLLRVPPTQGQIEPDLSDVLAALRDLFDGRIVKSQSSDEFTFERGKRSYGMPQTADGIKKIGILTTLIENRSLVPGSVLFLDEPETNLHPRAIRILVRLLFQLGQAGVQVFVATHNYLVIKQLQILAQQHGENVPFCSLMREEGQVKPMLQDLRHGMPSNPIVDESIRMYREELELELGQRNEA